MCEAHNKQMPLIAPGGRATSDDKVIGEHAWRMLKSFNFDPKELRGVAIQIQKLEKASGPQDSDFGQALLPFHRVETKKQVDRIEQEIKMAQERLGQGSAEGDADGEADGEADGMDVDEDGDGSPEDGRAQSVVSTRSSRARKMVGDF